MKKSIIQLGLLFLGALGLVPASSQAFDTARSSFLSNSKALPQATDSLLSFIDESSACLCPRDGSLFDLNESVARGGECSDIPIDKEDMYCLDCCDQRQKTDLYRQQNERMREIFINSYYECLDFLESLESRDTESLSRRELFKKSWCEHHPLKDIMEPLLLDNPARPS